MIFTDRQEAGRMLAEKLKQYKGKNTIIIALPRGGVPVGVEIAGILHVPLDVLPVRKIGFPGNPEYGIGAVAMEEVLYIDHDAMLRLDITPREIAEIAEQEIREVKRREKLYRKGKKPLNVANKSVILVDDGIATGVTTHAAIQALHKQKPKKLILAVPVCPEASAPEMMKTVDEFICLDMAEYFDSVGHFYHFFPQISDEEVVSLLNV